MNAQPSPAGVPLLDLAPKLRRPLQLWNPLDYLRLLYWAFFFPQAIRWYVETFARPESSEATGRDLLPAMRQDPVARNLVLMALLLTVLPPMTLAAGLQRMGVPESRFIVASTVVNTVAFGIAGGVAAGVARGIAGGVAGWIALGVAGMALNVALGVAPNVAIVAVSGALFWLAVGIAGGVAGVAGIGFGVALGVAGIAFGVAVIALNVALGVEGILRSVLLGIAGVVLNVASSITVVLLMILRLPDYLVGMLPTLWIWSRRGGALPHVTPLPLPGVQRRLEAWLQADWAAGVHNVNQVLAYSLQFIPAVRAVNRVLARMPEERLLPAVAELARMPYDWNLVRFGAVSLRRAMQREALQGFWALPSFLRRRWLERLTAEPRLDIPARAACAGFWYLHKKQPEKAAEAFGRVQRLPYGAEMAGLAAALAQALAAANSREVAVWAGKAASLPPVLQNEAGGASPLRPGTLSALRQLQEAAGEVHTASQAVSPALRSSAVGRAVGALARLIDSATEVCESPEGELVREVAVRWSDILARWGEEVGEEILLRPVENPFEEGASGRPVRRTFVRRGEVLAGLERWWSCRPDTPLPVIILYGHRRMGKSSILSHLLEKRPPHLLVAPADMQDLIAADHTGQLLLKFAEAIHRAAAPTLEAGPPPQAAEYATFGQASVALNRLLERLAPQMADRRLILTVDEYELAEEKIERGKFDPDFLRYLRAALTHHRWLNLILAGRQRLAQELRHYHAVFYGGAEPVRVTFLKREEAVALIRLPTDDFALDIEAPLADEIYRLTHGQPYLIQRLCYELVERWNERFRREGRDTPRRLTVADLQAILTPEFFRDFFLAADYYFSGVWEEAGPDGQRILRALARWEEGTAVGWEAVVRAAGLEQAAGEAALDTLLEHDLVVEAEGGIRLAVPLMHPWLRMAPSSEGG